MYLDTLFCENMGPIGESLIKASFTNEGLPKPIILVGKNGAGKTILLSNIVDALHEFGGQAFDDVVVKTEMGGHRYFKLTSSNHIKIGNQYLVGYLSMKVGGRKLEYLYHRGPITNDMLHNKLEKADIPKPTIRIQDSEDKTVSRDVDLIKSEFRKTVACYFPAYRYSIPDWMGADYSLSRHKDPYNKIFASDLARSIIVDNARFDTPSWIEDVVIDSRSDLIFSGQGILADSNIHEKQLLGIAKANIEKILTEILEQDVVLGLGYRSERERRLTIRKKRTKELISPSFDSLSTGQAILADLFVTILRYADAIDINKSIRIADIEGIVLIDEIDAHLHTDLQYKVLPSVMRLFPKIQFIVTAHSPLFVLGMQDKYGPEGFDLYELPNGNKIDAEEYREFQNAYEHFNDSRLAQTKRLESIDEAVKQVSKILNANADEILVFTEGHTDWMHIERAWTKLSSEYAELSGKLRFYHYFPTGKGNGEPELEMGDSELVSMCRQFAKVKQSQRIVFIADADNPKVTKCLTESSGAYKNWGNNVYSFQIPDSGLRMGFSDVCIEHYYTDAELQTPVVVDGVARRLFLAHEFNPVNGQTSDHKYFYENHKRLTALGQYGIIEGDKGNRVIELLADPANAKNIALPKSVFAQDLFADKDDFKNIKVDSFRKIFDILKRIAATPIVR